MSQNYWLKNIFGDEKIVVVIIIFGLNFLILQEAIILV